MGLRSWSEILRKIHSASFITAFYNKLCRDHSCKPLCINSLEPQAVPASCRTSSPSRVMQGYLKLLPYSLAKTTPVSSLYLKRWACKEPLYWLLPAGSRQPHSNRELISCWPPIWAATPDFPLGGKIAFLAPPCCWGMGKTSVCNSRNVVFPHQGCCYDCDVFHLLRKDVGAGLKLICKFCSSKQDLH